jgi:hypothetical protein
MIHVLLPPLKSFTAHPHCAFRQMDLQGEILGACNRPRPHKSDAAVKQTQAQPRRRRAENFTRAAGSAENWLAF